MNSRGLASLAAGLLAAGLLCQGSGARAQGLRDECAAPGSVMALGAPLMRTGERLVRGLPVKIVAIGSSSTAGAGASDAAHAYPAQLAAALERRFPLGRISVLNKGVNGEETPEMLARFQRDVFDEHPDLVIWQVGSNEILRNRAVEPFRVEVLDGIAQLHAAHIETILMDAQYAPRVLANPLSDAFNGEVREIAADAHVALLDRFAAMRYWLGKKGEPDMIGPDATHMTNAGYRCVGRLLASLIVADMPAMASR